MKNILFIAKKDILDKLHNPSAYIIAGLFILLWEFLFFQNIFLINDASLHPLIALVPWFFMFLIPALTMGSIAEEQEKNTLEFVLTNPVRESELVIGKYLGTLAYVAILTSVIFPIAWSLNLFGDVDFGTVVAQYIATILFASTATALGVCVSTFFKKQIAALIVSTVSLFLLVILGLEIVVSNLPARVGVFISNLGITSHFNSIARGVLDVRDMWYFVWSAVLFLALSTVHLIHVRRKPSRKTRAVRHLTLTALTAMFVITVGASLLPAWRIDLTENSIYIISKETREVLSRLNDDVHITFYASNNLPAKFEPIKRTTQDILYDYVRYGGGRVTVQVQDPSGNTNDEQQAATLGVRPVQFSILGSTEAQVKQGYLGVTVEVGNEHRSIPFVQRTGDIEYQITSFIYQLTTKEKKHVVFVTTSDQTGVPGSFNTFETELRKYYRLTTISTLDENISLPEDTSVLVIADRGGDMPDVLHKQIQSYLQHGGNALILVDPVRVHIPTMSASVASSSTETLLAAYGVHVVPALTYDLRANETVTIDGGLISYMVPYPFILKALVQPNPVVSAKVRVVSMPWASPVVFNNASTTHTLASTTLITTSQYAGVQTDVSSVDPQQSFSREGLSTYVLGVLLSGEGTTTPHIIVVGDTDFIGDQYGNNTPENIVFGLESVSWLSNSTLLGGIKIKENRSRPFVFANATQPMLIRYGNMGGAVLVLAITATYIFWKRRRRKNTPYNTGGGQ